MISMWYLRRGARSNNNRKDDYPTQRRATPLLKNTIILPKGGPNLSLNPEAVTLLVDQSCKHVAHTRVNHILFFIIRSALLASCANIVWPHFFAEMDWILY